MLIMYTVLIPEMNYLCLSMSMSTGFPAVDGVLAVASVPANPDVHISASGGFTYCIEE